ncbi:MAG: hypothetical protein J7539_02645 [Niabella sp.]|nr:hypothetical protein [Niabella sp.]
MLLVKSITLRKLNAIACKYLAVAICCTGFNLLASAQDNSPYSRYALGDEISSSSATNRGMGGVSAAYNSPSTVNYSNPASYSFFQSISEAGTKKQIQGRVVLDIGLEGQGRTMTDNTKQARFTSTNILFNRVSVGVPLRRNWGLAFGLRPLNRISYDIEQKGILNSAGSGQPIDSATTNHQGYGGLYLASAGTGVKFKVGKDQYISLGVNGGYMFGSQNYTTTRSLYNDSTYYATGTWDTRTGMGKLYADAGFQYMGRISKNLYLGIGAYGNWKQTINTSSDINTSSVNYSSTAPDTSYSHKSIKGNIVYPTNTTVGFVLQKPQTATQSGWLFGADFTSSKWQQFRVNGVPDSAVNNNWKLKVGAEFSPIGKKNYFSHASYRVGFYTGPDYITYNGSQLPTYGVSAGIGLPLANYNQMAQGQFSMINLAFEYFKRGNSKNPLQENVYRVTVGFSLTDLWFGKRRSM